MEMYRITETYKTVLCQVIETPGKLYPSLVTAHYLGKQLKLYQEKEQISIIIVRRIYNKKEAMFHLLCHLVDLIFLHHCHQGERFFPLHYHQEEKTHLHHYHRADLQILWTQVLLFLALSREYGYLCHQVTYRNVTIMDHLNGDRSKNHTP